VTELVVGVDAGATSTRALVATLDGDVVGRGAAPGANSGLPQDRLAAVLTSALGGLDPARVRAGVIGVRGLADVSVMRSAADMAWWSAGFNGRPELVTDLEAAFASGTPQPDGLLLQAGTGAAAAALCQRRIRRRCDGHGWLLGDQGSAVWLGLRGVRAALDAWDGRGATTRLCADLAEQVGARPDEDVAQVLVTRLHAADPAQLGSLAPLVSRAAEAGDGVAAGLVDAAADRLVAGLWAVTSAQSSGEPAGDPSGHSSRGLSGELVLAGALLAGGPVRSAVLQRLAGSPLRLHAAASRAAGAVVLALAGRGVLDPEVHARLISTTG
jgi:N-acetylglucosamine kinase-like BadF-type ATPase